MKRSNLTVQCDLFRTDASPMTLASLERHHDQLVELLSRMLWDVACGAEEIKESCDEQDQS